MKLTIFILLSCITMAVSVIATFISLGHYGPVKAVEFEPELADSVTTHINQYRGSINLPRVKENKIVCDLATIRSMEVSRNFSHSGFFGRYNDPEYLKYIRFARHSENVSRFYTTGEAVVDAWINSPAHKVVLEEHFDYGCVACYEDFCVLNTITLMENK
jgi:uncharacterized protein YkwD